jgi:hypothetical protein
MHEDIGATTIGGDETEALGVVEPLYGTHCHFRNPLSNDPFPGLSFAVRKVSAGVSPRASGVS